MLKVIEDVKEERERQDAKWGEQLHDPYTWIAILGEEYGEVCKAALEDNGGYRDELVQVAAVAIAAIESYDKTVKKLVAELPT